MSFLGQDILDIQNGNWTKTAQATSIQLSRKAFEYHFPEKIHQLYSMSKLFKGSSSNS